MVLAVQIRNVEIMLMITMVDNDDDDDNNNNNNNNNDGETVEQWQLARDMF
jgi:hypothetical protein